MIETLTAADNIDRFSEWVDDHEWVGLHATCTREGLIALLTIANEDGEAWLVDATDRDLLVSVLRLARGRELWASDARKLTTSLWDTYSIRGLDPIDAGTIERLVFPGAPADADEVSAWNALRELFGGGRDWRDRALLESPIYDTRLHRAVTPPAIRAAQVACERGAEWIEIEIETERAWRETADAGFLVDREALAETLLAAENVSRHSRRQFRVDLSRDSRDTRDWLAERGIVIQKPSGEDTLSHHAYEDAIVPENARADFDEFVRIRLLTRDAGKLREIDSALDGDRVFPVIDTAGAITGRFAMRQPSLHNLSSHMKPLFLADEGYVLVGADLSHVEPSIAAAMSGDPAFIAAVVPGSDPYLTLASSIWKEDISDPEDRRRKTSKVALLASLYGQGNDSLAERLGVDAKRASEIRRGIDIAFPKFARWRKSLMRSVENGEEFETFYGRPLPLPEPDEAYKAVNYAIQGTAADFFKRRTLAVLAEMTDDDRLYLPIHDELIVMTRPERADKIAALLTRTFSGDIGVVHVEAEGRVLGSKLMHA